MPRPPCRIHNLVAKNIVLPREHITHLQTIEKAVYVTTINIYAPNIGAPQYIRQTLTGIRGEIDSNTTIFGDFNTPLTLNGQIIKTEDKFLSILFFLLQW